MKSLFKNDKVVGPINFLEVRGLNGHIFLTHGPRRISTFSMAGRFLSLYPHRSFNAERSVFAPRSSKDLGRLMPLNAP